LKHFIKDHYDIDTDRFKRYDQRDSIFGRLVYDKNAPFYKTDMYERVIEVVNEGKPGYSRMDFARVIGSWSVYNHFSEAFGSGWQKDGNVITGLPGKMRYEVEDKARMSDEIKKTVRVYGGFKAGITTLNRDWVYTHDINGKKIEIPDSLKYVIVVLIKMNPEAIVKSPEFEACIETGKGYSMSAFVIACLAGFIRNLGYSALSMGNDTALSIPLAVEAGLGELGRNGLLITPENGPCVIIGKIFTDMPLAIDPPVDFGIREFCKKCARCAESCEVDAIQEIQDPNYEQMCPSNNTGIKRWTVDHYKCYNFWIENGGECSTCIATCPFFNRAYSSR